MADQNAKSFLVAFNEESTLGVAAAAAGAGRFRTNPSPGLVLNRQAIRSNEFRPDGMRSMPRLGSKEVTGSYAGDLSAGTFDRLIQAGVRGTWVAATTVTQATAGLTSVTTGANTIVASAGSWITAGFRVGDVFVPTGLPDAANNGKNLRVTGVSTLTLTVAETLVVNAGPDSAFSLVIARKVTQPTVPVDRSFTIEQYATDLDLTEQLVGNRVNSMRFALQPNGMLTVDFGFLGLDLNPLAVGTSPFFTTPTLTATIGLVAVDASIRFGGAAVTNLSTMSINYDLGGSTLPVIGSTTSPGVFLGNASITGDIAGTRRDFTNLNRYINETELELHVMAVEPDSEPKDFISIFLPRIKLMSPPSGALGGDGAYIESMSFEAAAKEATTGYDTSMLSISTSAA